MECKSATNIFPNQSINQSINQKSFSFFCQVTVLNIIYHTWILAVIPAPKSKWNKRVKRGGLFSGSSYTYTHHPRHQLLSNIEYSAMWSCNYSRKVGMACSGEVRWCQPRQFGLQFLSTALHIATKCNEISKYSKTIEAHRNIRLLYSG